MHTGDPRGGPPSGGPSAVSAELGRESLDVTWWIRALSLLARLAVIALAVLLCDWLLPGFHADTPGGPVAFAVVLGLVALVMQPVMVGGAVLLGWAGVLLLAFVGQAVVVLLAAELLPSVDGRRLPGPPLLVAVVVGLVGSVASWFSTAGTVAGAGRPAGRVGPAAPGRRRGPRGRRRRVRAARRGPVPGAPDGDHRRHGARRSPAGSAAGTHTLRRVDPQAAGDHAGQPDGHPARRDRRHPGLPLVRPGPRPGDGGQQARGTPP